MPIRSRAKRSRLNANKSYVAVKSVMKPGLASALKPNSSFLRLPLEIRNMIYGYYLTSVHTRNPAQALISVDHQYAEDIRARTSRLPQFPPSAPFPTALLGDLFEHWREPRVLETTLMQTCKSIFAEMNDFIYCDVKVELRMWTSTGWRKMGPQKLVWSARDKGLLCNAQRIKIELDLSDWLSNRQYIAPPDVAMQLQKRKNLLEVEFSGAGWKAFERGGKRYAIERILRQFSKVKARDGVKFSWYYDNGNPVHCNDRNSLDRLMVWHEVKADVRDWAEWYRGRVASLDMELEAKACTVWSA